MISLIGRPSLRPKYRSTNCVYENASHDYQCGHIFTTSSFLVSFFKHGRSNTRRLPHDRELFAIRCFSQQEQSNSKGDESGVICWKIFLTTANINDRKTRDYRLIYIPSFFIVSLSLRFLIDRGCARTYDEKSRKNRREGRDGTRWNSTYPFYFVVS